MLQHHFKALGFSIYAELERFGEQIKCENDLADVAGNDFLFVFKSVAQELSQLTQKTYCDYLEEAKQMIADGKSLSDCLYYYQLLLMQLKGEV